MYLPTDSVLQGPLAPNKITVDRNKVNIAFQTQPNTRALSVAVRPPGLAGPSIVSPSKESVSPRHPRRTLTGGCTISDWGRSKKPDEGIKRRM